MDLVTIDAELECTAVPFTDLVSFKSHYELADIPFSYVFHKRVEMPNAAKLSDSRSWRAGCMVAERRR
jgi:hypothetical protein